MQSQAHRSIYGLSYGGAPPRNQVYTVHLDWERQNKKYL